MASLSLVISQPKLWGVTVSQVSLPIGGKYIVDGGVIGVTVVSVLLHPAQHKMNKALIMENLIYII